MSRIILYLRQLFKRRDKINSLREFPGIYSPKFPGISPETCGTRAVMAFCRAAPFVVLDVDGVLHPLSEKGLPVNAAFEDLSKRAEEELEDDGLCIFTTIAG